MKTINKILTIVLISLVVVSCEKSDLNPVKKGNRESNTMEDLKQVYIDGGAASVTLFAGQDIDAGTVAFNVTGDNLIISYNTTNGFVLKEVHLWVGENLSGMPQTKSGNPKIGNFPYTATQLSGLTTYQFVIPLSTFGGEPYVCDKQFYIAAHASVQKDNADGTFQSETAWGNGERIVERGNWATYFTILFTCNNGGGGTVLEDCETAFAYDNSTFIDYGLTTNRWGWVIDITSTGTFQTPVYAGAAQNNISKGEHVGTLTYTYNGSSLTVSFDMFSGFLMSETQVYASSEVPTTIAPGQYGNLHENLDGAVKDTYTIPVSGSTVYLIAHAVVCK